MLGVKLLNVRLASIVKPQRVFERCSSESSRISRTHHSVSRSVAELQAVLRISTGWWAMLLLMPFYTLNLLLAHSLDVAITLYVTLLCTLTLRIIKTFT